MTDNILTPQQMRALADEPEYPFTDETVEWEEHMRAALRTAADQLEAVQALLAEAHDKFAATYDAERMTGRGPSSIGVAGAPLASSVQRALDLLRAKATANIERLTAEAARSAATAYGERLRAVVENAPHDGDCRGFLNGWASSKPCDCWKAEVI